MKTNNVDLSKSFERLKDSIFAAKKIVDSEDEYNYAHAFGYLNGAIKQHFFECTGESIYKIELSQTDKEIEQEFEDHDDLKGVL